VRERIEMLARPGASRSVGEIAGTGEGGPCSGGVVRVQDVDREDGRVMFEAQALPDGPTGWLSETAVGPVLDLATCRAILGPDAAACDG
jgi:hypothetical protein